MNKCLRHKKFIFYLKNYYKIVLFFFLFLLFKRSKTKNNYRENNVDTTLYCCGVKIPFHHKNVLLMSNIWLSTVIQKFNNLLLWQHIQNVSFFCECNNNVYYKIYEENDTYDINIIGLCFHFSSPTNTITTLTYLLTLYLTTHFFHRLHFKSSINLRSNPFVSVVLLRRIRIYM